jgi:hypothetical protein
MNKILTLFQLTLLRQEHARNPLRLPLLLGNFGPQLCCLRTELLRIRLKCHKLVPPEIALGHQEVEPAGQASDLRLQLVTCVDKRRSTFAD